MHVVKSSKNKAKHVISSKISNQGRKGSISGSKTVSLVETWGQAAVQDEGSFDHGSSVFPVIYFMCK